MLHRPLRCTTDCAESMFGLLSFVGKQMRIQSNPYLRCSATLFRRLHKDVANATASDWKAAKVETKANFRRRNEFFREVAVEKRKRLLL